MCCFASPTTREQAVQGLSQLLLPWQERQGFRSGPFVTSWTTWSLKAGSSEAIRQSPQSTSPDTTAAQWCTTFNYYGVQILHPVLIGVQMAQRGATQNRTGCNLEQNGVQQLHPIRY